MTNVQAAIGVAQLEQLEAFIQVKTENYKHYESYIKNINGLSLFSFNERARNNHWFYTLLTNSNILTRDVLIQKLKERNIETRPIWKLIHTQSIYEENQAYFIEKAYTYWNQMINIPCSSNLSIEEIDYVIKELNGLYN
jgi:perosamine synthetase